MTRVIVEPSDGDRYIDTADLLTLLAGAGSLVLETPGGRVPKIMRIVKDGNTVTVRLTN